MSSTYPQIPPSQLLPTIETTPTENRSAPDRYPADASNERIARLRSELQGVRTGIQRIVSGLQDLNDTTHQQELAAEATLSRVATSVTSGDMSPPRDSNLLPPVTLEAAAQSNASLPRFQGPSVSWHPARVEMARGRPVGQEPNLRTRQRAYLESDQQRQGTPSHQHGGILLRQHTHSRSVRQNTFLTLGTREEVEHPDHQSPLASMYGNALGEYRRSEAARQSQAPGAFNATTTAQNQQPAMPNPLMNPPATPQYTPPFLSNPQVNGARPQMNPMGYPPMLNVDLFPPGNYMPPQPDSALWSHDYPPPANRIRRQQSYSSPDRPNGIPFTPNSNRRASDLHRRGASRGESEGGTFGRALDLSGAGMIPARVGYPYILPGGLARDQYLAEIHGRGTGSDTESEPSPTFDTQDRPPPMKPESMMLDMACSICKEHLVDTVVLPCGHAVMCNWCADLQIPSRKSDHTIPKDRMAKCPMCRSRVKNKYKIFHS